MNLSAHLVRASRTGVALLLLASGCTVGPDYVSPEPPASPGEFHALNADSGAPTPSRAVAGEFAASRWWHTLADPLLDDLVERGVRANHDVRIAAARVRQARAQRGVAASTWYPEVDARAGYQRSRSSDNTQQGPGFSTGEIDLFQFGFDASWEIDVFGGTRRAVEAAEAEQAAAESSLRDVLVTLTSEIARNYVEVRSAQRRLGVIDRAVRAQTDTVQLTEARFRAGLRSELDVAQARAQLASREAQAPPLRFALMQATHRLGVLLGESPDSLLGEFDSVRPIPSPPPEIPVGLPSELLRRRPDIRRAERQLAASNARIGAATADLFPRISLTGNFGLEASQFGDLFDINSRAWSIGPSVRWPIFQGGRIRSNIDVQKARQDEALATYEQTVLRAFEEVENALVAFVQSQRRREALGRAVDANQRAVELAKQLYTGGIGSFLDVLDSERALYDAEDQLATSDRDVTSDLIALCKALGGGWEPPAPAPNESPENAAAPAAAAPAPG